MVAFVAGPFVVVVAPGRKLGQCGQGIGTRRDDEGNPPLWVFTSQPR
jgi:hypothetical protein